MGADLYIRTPVGDDPTEMYRGLFDTAVRERDKHAADSPEALEWQREVERYYDRMFTDNPFYFRDSYNDSSVMWQLGLSWWGDVIPMLTSDDEEGSYLAPADCLKLADMVESRSLSLELPDYKAVDESFSHVPVRKMTDDEVKEWRNYFEKKKANLVAFLKRGAEMDGIRCSL